MVMSESYIATRRTAQGSIVHLWPDGAITWALGRYVRGSAAPRTEEAKREALAAGWLVMGDVELYDDSELPALIAAARWTAKRGGDPGMMRDRMHRAQLPKLIWTTVEADRDGNPTVQVCRLPRLMWPGLSVWRERGVYSVWTIDPNGTCFPTGVRLARLSELNCYLDTIREI